MAVTSPPARLLAARVVFILAIALLVLLGVPHVVRAEEGSHGPFATDTDACARCHATHSAAGSTRHLLGPGTLASQSELCFACHGSEALGADTNIQNGPDSFTQPSGHVLEGALETGDLTNSCGSCHEVHDDPGASPSLPLSSVNATNITGDVTSWCLACHDDSRSWEPSGYPDVAHPERDVLGYPVKGTFPGSSTYLDPSRNAHSQLPTSSPDQQPGDCRICHNSHGGPNAYDALKFTYRPSSVSNVVDDRVNGTYAEACFVCHGGQTEWTSRGAVDIRSFVTSNATDPDSFGGHRIKTIGATQPLNAPLLCYECHDAHGSSRGNRSLISDERGANLRSDTSEDLRRFCFTCHSSDDGMVWSSSEATYTAVSATDTVSGLRRDGTLLPGQVSSEASWTTNWLRLSTTSDAHSSIDVEPCYACHGGGDYGSATGNNVHNPARGGVDSIIVEAITKPCYDCHGSFQPYMEDGAGDKIGANRTDAYHHVLGGPSGDGDTPTPDGYLDSTTEIRCSSCHQGHTADATQTVLLRAGIDVAATVTANTDYLPTGSGGICVSCHATALAKDLANQKSDTATSTPVIAGGVGAGGFGASAHSFETTVALPDGSVFRPNCSKCHSEGLTASSTSGLTGDQTHWFSIRRLLAKLGGTSVDPMQETECFRCHSRRADGVGGTVKGAAGKDWYGVATMTPAAESVFAQFSRTSRHPISGSLNGSVECENCHNVHSVSATSPVSDPRNTNDSYSYTTPFNRTQFCLRCHSGSLPAASVGATQYVPWSVTIAAADAAIMNKATNAARSHSTANGSISGPETVECTGCHDEHASGAPRLLGVYDVASGTNRIGATTVTANNNTVCYACHTTGNAAIQSYDASGYPTNGRWPGLAVYAGVNGRHNLSNVIRPGTTYAGGDCKNCHEVHGSSSNVYDELRGSVYSSSYFGFCFDCHNASHVKGLNQWQYYPIAAGGTSTDSRAGHATVTTGARPAGSAMPCYDCHNGHGSANPDMLEVHTWTGPTTMVIVGDNAGEISMATSVGVRMFCLTCHTTSNTAKGWTGSALAVVPPGTRVEGIDRVSTSARLRLPSTQAAHAESGTQNCEGNGCHGHTYGGTRPANVHDPRVN